MKPERAVYGFFTVPMTDGPLAYAGVGRDTHGGWPWR